MMSFQSTKTMDAAVTKSSKKGQKIIYKECTEDEKQMLLKEKDKKNTQLSTEHEIQHLKHYLNTKHDGGLDLNQMTPSELNDVLMDYYRATGGKLGQK